MKLRPFLLVSACLAAASLLPAQDAEVPAPEIRLRTEFAFQTTPGAAYLVEGTHDGQTWVTVAGPIFGDGTTARAMLPVEATAYANFRVRTVAASTFGPATTALGGKTISLNDKGTARQVILLPAIQGVTRGILKTDDSHARSFVWSVKRISGGEVALTLQFFDGTRSTLDLNFATTALGSYQMRDRNLAGEVQVMEAGMFGISTGRIRDNPDQAKPPITLSGRSIGFGEGGELTIMNFAAVGNSVTLKKADGSTETLNYDYDLTSPRTADLRIDGPGKTPQLYQIAMDTQAAGQFNRVPLSMPGGDIIPGLLPQPGIVNIPITPVLPNSATGPPKSLEGKVMQINGDKPVTLTFNGDGTGAATREDEGSVEVEPFTYDYSPTDADEASLALTYPGADTDRVEDYDLDFSGNAGGNFQNNTYEGGELAHTGTGSFNTGAR